MQTTSRDAVIEADDNDDGRREKKGERFLSYAACLYIKRRVVTRKIESGRGFEEGEGA